MALSRVYDHALGRVVRYNLTSNSLNAVTFPAVFPLPIPIPSESMESDSRQHSHSLIVVVEDRRVVSTTHDLQQPPGKRKRKRKRTGVPLLANRMKFNAKLLDNSTSQSTHSGRLNGQVSLPFRGLTTVAMLPNRNTVSLRNRSIW